MPRKQKKKAQAAEEEPEVEIIAKVEVIYEDTKSITGIDLEYKWGEVYHMISSKIVPDAGFEDMHMYANIEKSALIKVATRPEIFPCLEVISWILPRVDVTRMILENIAKQGYAAYSLGYVSMGYNLPTTQVYLIESWLKELNLDMLETINKMMIPGNKFRTRTSGEYETSTLCTPYRFTVLMMNINFGRDNGKRFKMGWIPFIYFFATQGTIFNWESIVSNNLSACISAALGRVSQKNS